MLAAVPDHETADRRFVIHPNRSLSWRGNWLFIALVSVVLLTVALGSALAGVWLIAPFAGLELLLVMGVLYALRRRGRRTEIIDVSRPAVTISVARKRLEHRIRLPRDQSRVILSPSSRRGHPSRLFVTARDMGVEVGRCLGEQERRGLAVALRAAIHPAAGPVGRDDHGAG
jgi:uncharacterized membrane protein